MIDLPGIELVPAPVQILGDGPKLDNEVPGQVLRLDLASFLPPQPHQGDLVIAHDDPGVGAADEGAAVSICVADFFMTLDIAANFRISHYSTKVVSVDQLKMLYWQIVDHVNHENR